MICFGWTFTFDSFIVLGIVAGIIFFFHMAFLVFMLNLARLERAFFPRRSSMAVMALSEMPYKKVAEAFIYGVLPKTYFFPARLGKFGAWLMDKKVPPEKYHGKVLRMDDAAKIIQLDQPLERDLEHIIPFETARQIILNHPLPSIAAIECVCRSVKKNPCQPTDVCLLIGEPYVTFTIEHRPGKARRLKVDEALQILEDEDKRGHIHTAWFKDCMNDRFYALCNCCTCCCEGMKSYNRGLPRIIHSGYKPVIEEDLCVNCGACAKVCPFHAISSTIGVQTIINYDLCMGCGLCETHCPKWAIDLDLAPGRGIPLDVDILVAEQEAEKQAAKRVRHLPVSGQKQAKKKADGQLKRSIN